MGQTKIEWTDVTVNPFPGCRKVSEGCRNCYAERMAQRLKTMGHPAYQKIVNSKGWTGETYCAGAAFRIPGKGKLVFVNSMGDVFYERNPFVGGIDVLFETILTQPQHTFQILTKRPERALRYYREIVQYENGDLLLKQLPNAPHLWLGVTCENQRWADERIPILLRIPAAVRFVSLEPLLGLVTFVSRPGYLHPLLRYSCPTCADRYGPNVQRDRICPSCGVEGYETDRIDLVIVGPETGPNARPCSLEWIENIVLQCHAANVPVFVKAVRCPVSNKLIKDIEGISARLGHPPEKLRQYPQVKEPIERSA